jgi:hypothetical protein
MRWKIRHETHYRYTLPLQYLIQHLRLTPDNSLHQQVHQWQVSAPSALEAGIDAFTNQQHTLSLIRPVSSVSLSAPAGQCPVATGFQPGHQFYCSGRKR